MTPARVEVHPRTCATCKHHQRPAWETRGFGSCFEVARVGLVRAVGTKGAFVATHETFACAAWDGRR